MVLEIVYHTTKSCELRGLYLTQACTSSVYSSILVCIPRRLLCPHVCILQYTGLEYHPSFVVSVKITLYILVYPSILCVPLQCRSSYEAYLQYPVEVSELQELKGLLSGGTTVVLAVIINDRLHIANVGDSRALLVRELNDGNLDLEQLSTDHGVDNDNELARLVAIGLDGEQLRKSGRLGSQENTRSIGDYCLQGWV